MIHAVIPVKSLLLGKSRLAHLLSSKERQQLIQRLLAHGLQVLQQAPSISKIWVVSHDDVVLQMAKGLGAELVREVKIAGMNTAVSLGTQIAVEHGATAVLILPADLPYLQVADVEALTAELRPPLFPQLIISGDEEQQGTNALLLSPAQPFRFHYGPSSFAKHLAEGKRHSYAYRILPREGIAFDLDTEADWLEFEGSYCPHF